MALYGRQGKIVARPGQGEALTRVMLGAAERADEMAGCRLYLIATRKDEPEAVLVTEVWDNAAAHAASLNNPNVIATIAEARPLIERVEGFGMDVLGGLGVEIAHNGDGN